jgi:hypothetical protein
LSGICRLPLNLSIVFDSTLRKRRRLYRHAASRRAAPNGLSSVIIICSSQPSPPTATTVKIFNSTMASANAAPLSSIAFPDFSRISDFSFLRFFKTWLLAFGAFSDSFRFDKSLLSINATTLTECAHFSQKNFRKISERAKDSLTAIGNNG